MHRRLGRRSFLAISATAPVLAVGGAQAAYLAQATPDDLTTSPLDPASTALLVMDFQDAWLQTLDNPDAVLTQAVAAIAIAREQGVPVAYAQVTFSPADYGAVPERNIIFNQIARPPGVLDEDAPGNAINERVAPEPLDKLVRKTRVSAFARTDLDEWLRNMGIDTLILAGISTSGVVLSTVCDSADLDYRVLVLGDACADRDPDIQKVLMEKVFPQRAEVIQVADIPGLLALS